MIAKSNLMQAGVIFALSVLGWIAISGMLLSANVDTAWGKAIILWDRLKIEPEMSVTQTFDDNIYKTDTQEQDDFITSVKAGLDTQFAFSPRARLDLAYEGVFDLYKDANNFRKDDHYANVSYRLDTAKGSTAEFGAWGEDTAEQPYSPSDRSKDYSIGAFYIDVDVKLLASTECFGSYERSQRRFDEEIDRIDDYNRNFFALGLVNTHSSRFPVLLEYRHDTQNNDRGQTATTDFTSQAALAGFKWGQEHRLSGNLRVGYLWSEFNSKNAYDGWATDTDLTYAAGPFTDVTATASRGTRESTISARDTLDYYIYEGTSLSLHYTRLDPVMLLAFGAYENREYRTARPTSDQRKDDNYAAGISAQYRMRDWISFSLGYQYRKNDSSVESLSYVENRVLAQIVLFSTDHAQRRRFEKNLDDLKYF